MGLTQSQLPGKLLNTTAKGTGASRYYMPSNFEGTDCERNDIDSYMSTNSEGPHGITGILLCSWLCSPYLIILIIYHESRHVKGR